MIRFCHICERGFIDVWRPASEPAPTTCSRCGRGRKPLSRRVDGICLLCGGFHKGTCQEEAERKQREREAKA